MTVAQESYCDCPMISGMPRGGGQMPNQAQLHQPQRLLAAERQYLGTDA
jgi:hypothetical protein